MQWMNAINKIDLFFGAFCLIQFLVFFKKCLLRQCFGFSWNMFWLSVTKTKAVKQISHPYGSEANPILILSIFTNLFSGNVYCFFQMLDQALFLFLSQLSIAANLDVLKQRFQTMRFKDIIPSSYGRIIL